MKKKIPVVTLVLLGLIALALGSIPVIDHFAAKQKTAPIKVGKQISYRELTLTADDIAWACLTPDAFGSSKRVDDLFGCNRKKEALRKMKISGVSCP